MRTFLPQRVLFGSSMQTLLTSVAIAMAAWWTFTLKDWAGVSWLGDRDMYWLLTMTLYGGPVHLLVALQVTYNIYV